MPESIQKNNRRKVIIILFVIERQKEFDADTEQVFHDLLNQKYLHEVMHADINDFDTDIHYNEKMQINKRIAIGTIPFVERFLQYAHGIPYMQPIEIPDCLKKEEYLLRDYKVVQAKDIPMSGMWFIKDASRLKRFSYCGEMKLFMYDGIFDKPKKNETSLHLNPEHQFVLSEVIQILSEYRVFVWKDEIKGIQYYDGEPTIMPNENEIKKLQKIVLNYQIDKERPHAYSMDIAVIKKDGHRDLALIEIHPFACLGLYGFYSTNLPYMYADGFNYYINAWKNGLYEKS